MKTFNPNDYPDIYFPNWFYKEYFEIVLGEKISDEKFQEIKQKLDKTGLADEISELVDRYLYEVLYEE